MRARGFTAVPNWLLTEKRVNATAMRVYLAVASHADQHGYCWPSHQTIASEAGVTRETAHRSLKILRDVGALSWTRTGASNRYRIAQSDVTLEGVSDVSAASQQVREDVTAEGVSDVIEESHKQDPENKTQRTTAGSSSDQGQLPFLASVVDLKPAPARQGKRATQLPESWKPNDGHAAFVAENGLNGGYELAQFRDYHIAKGSTMKDWDAAFRTWLRRAGTGPSRAGAGGRSSDDENAWMRRRPAR